MQPRGGCQSFLARQKHVPVAILLASARIHQPCDETVLVACQESHKYGTAARPLLLSILENPDESPALRRNALAALDKVGTPFGSWGKVRDLRKALARKQEILDREFMVPAMQIIPPPLPPPRTPREFFLCREEAGLPPVAEPPESAAKPDRTDKSADEPFASCLHARLCGPDEDDYRATMVKCCGLYGGSPPWFCAPSSTRESR